MPHERVALILAGTLIAVAGWLIVTSRQQMPMPDVTAQRDDPGIATSEAFQVERLDLILTALAPLMPTATETPRHLTPSDTKTPPKTYAAGYATPGEEYIIPQRPAAIDLVLTFTPVWCPDVTPDKYLPIACTMPEVNP